MNALVCEMCGSNEVVKQDSYFVCQACGTKYSVEEAKKMMIEGTVNVQGAVKIDNTDFIEKWLINARRAMQKEDWEETIKYYSKVEENAPTNIEAIFFSSYGKVRASFINPDLFQRKAAFNVLQNCISFLDDFFRPNDKQDIDILSEISNLLIKIFDCNFTYNKYTDSEGKVVRTDLAETNKLMVYLNSEFALTQEKIAKKISQENKYDRIFFYKLAIKHYDDLFKNHYVLINSKVVIERMMRCHELIHEIDPTYEVPEPPKDGCYVATAVYGSYDCPQVWTLRRYRDFTLAETWYGRAFIRTYYAISPTLVKWFGNTNWFKKLWKGKLDRMVAKLNENGVENTPYKDKNW